MKDLIEALQIFLKYGNDDYAPTHCEHDVLYIGDGIELDEVSEEDIKKLDDLGFFWSDDHDGFISYRFGSC
jgi:hypothetical protein